MSRAMLRIISRLATVAMAFATSSSLARTDVLGSGKQWAIEQDSRADHAKVAPFLGRDALWLRASTHVIRNDVSFINGTVEFDLAPMDDADFVGIVFHRNSLANHENIYIRPHRSGEFMAIQYAPRFNGSSTWQLYPEFTAVANWPRNAWTHVRIEINGSKLDVFIGDATIPALSVPRLRQTAEGTEIGFWARVNDKPDQWAGAISNLQIRYNATPSSRLQPATPPDGYVTNWEITGPIDASDEISPETLKTLKWAKTDVEESGLVNLNRSITVKPNQRLKAIARTTLYAKRAERVRLGIGYSDNVTVILNGQPIYSGINGWDTRNKAYVSFVDARFENAWLPLRAGKNDLMLVVSDDQRFGWGFAAQLDPSVDVISNAKAP